MSDTALATAFAEAYRAHAAEYYAGTIGLKENVRTFWRDSPTGALAHTPPSLPASFSMVEAGPFADRLAQEARRVAAEACQRRSR